MKTLLFALPVLLIFGLSPALAETEPSENPFTLEVTLDQETYAWSDTLVADVVLRSNSQYDLTLTFPDTCYLDVTVVNADGETVLREDAFCGERSRTGGQKNAKSA